MGQTAEATTIEREIAIAASPETIWEFLVDPAKITRWMGTTADFDARPGGAWRLHVVGEHTAAGEFVELDAPHRLVYTWGWEPGADGANRVPVGSTSVEIDLVPEGDGTLLRFTHRDLPGAESVESHTHGWTHYLARLATVGAGDDPGRDPWLDGPM